METIICTIWLYKQRYEEKVCKKYSIRLRHDNSSNNSVIHIYAVAENRENVSPVCFAIDEHDERTHNQQLAVAQ